MESSAIHLFVHLNKHLAGKQFATDANLKQVVTSCLQTYTCFIYAKIHPSVLRWNKYLSASDDYREVWCVPSALKLRSIRRSRIKFSVSECLLPYFLELPCSTVSYCAVQSSNLDWNLWFFESFLHSLQLRRRSCSLPLRRLYQLVIWHGIDMSNQEK
jgi:hypothetical protein